ncbi:hypothetical protein CTAYLR_008623 [Chrysophaeum taylorii]|uniref:Glycosyltransferase 2-like domain-containing protein n=1 Tax=Chrysophaeum taylorii TaxID=2483200 RepID=A0AAD7XNS8_9STRA|nr:hypothetical protein CTAYLR_008623 [Chrysophaeum taylorii]
MPFLYSQVVAAVMASSAAVCPAGVLRRPWTEGRAASRRLSPNPKCPQLLGGQRNTTGSSAAAAAAAAAAALTLALTYFENEVYLAQQLAKFAAVAVEKRIFLVIVDDGSREGRRAYEHASSLANEASLFERIAIYEIDRNLGFNVAGARNLAFAMAPTEYVLLMDMDTQPTMAFLDQALGLAAFAAKRLASSAHGTHVVFHRFVRESRCKRDLGPHPAVMLLSKAAYWRAGGCDEDFAGLYGSTHFRWRAQRTPTVEYREVDRNATKFLQHIGAPCAMDADASCCGRRRGKNRHLGEAHSNRTRENRAVFKAKKNRRIDWASTYLRFSWTRRV